MTSTFDFRLIHPDGPLSQHIQAIWSASVASSSAHSVTKPLFSDGSSGVFINLQGAIVFNEQVYGHGAYWTPVKQKAELIHLQPGNQSVGFRFQPATMPSDLGDIGERLFAKGHGREQVDIYPLELDDLIHTLMPVTDLNEQVDVLTQWLDHNIESQNTPPSALSQAISAIHTTSDILSIEAHLPLSLRQIERQFKEHAGLTPKQYQRLIRLRTAIDRIKQQPEINLAELALDTGYADQAHMTREFRKLADMTPKQYQLYKTEK